jgi:hypothetical protein
MQNEHSAGPKSRLRARLGRILHPKPRIISTTRPCIHCERRDRIAQARSWPPPAWPPAEPSRVSPGPHMASTDNPNSDDTTVPTGGTRPETPSKPTGRTRLATFSVPPDEAMSIVTIPVDEEYSVPNRQLSYNGLLPPTQERHAENRRRTIEYQIPTSSIRSPSADSAHTPPGSVRSSFSGAQAQRGRSFQPITLVCPPNTPQPGTSIATHS